MKNKLIIKKFLMTSFLSFAFPLLLIYGEETYSEHFIVGVEDIEYYPLYAMREREYSGFSRELLDSFAAASGHDFEYRAFPVKRLVEEFVKGNTDFKFPDSPYWRTDVKEGKKIIYSDEVLEFIDGVLVPPENIGMGKNYLKTLGIPRGFTAFDYLDDIANNTINLHESNTLKSLMKMVASKRIQGVYFNIIVARYYLMNTEFNQDAVIFDKTLPHTRDYYHLSTIKHPKIMEEFNAFLANNKAQIETLKAKYNVTLY